MADTGAAQPSTRRALTGAVLLDLAVSPLFAWNVFTSNLHRDLGASDALLAGVFSVGLLVFCVGVVIGGRVADTTSPRRLAVTALVGTVAGLLGSATASSVAVLFVTFSVLIGGSTGLGYATAVRVAGTGRSRRGLALSVVVSAYAAGTAVLAPVASALLVAVGRAWTFVVLAGAIGAVLVLAAVLVPGLRPTPSRTTPGGRRARPSAAVVTLWAAFGLGSAPALAAFAQAGSLVRTAESVALAVALLNVGNLAGRLGAGPLSDRIGRRAALHANSALLVLACVPLATGTSGPLALIALLLLGLEYGALSTLTPAATADVVPADRFGTTYGLVFTGWGIAGLLAPVSAATLAIEVGYSGAYLAFLFVAALAWTCTAMHGRAAPDPR